MNNDLEQYAKNSFTDSELEFMAHGNNPVANAYRELLAFRGAAKQATPATPSPKKPNHAQCCAEAGGDPRYCDCVNKDHVYLSTLDTTPQPAHTEQSGWIKCSDNLPAETEDADGGATGYLVRYENDRVPNGGFNIGVSNCVFLRTHWRGLYSHWMPLPTAPKPESE